MASLADIPEHLFEQGKTDDFIQWISELPIPLHLKLSLSADWAIASSNLLSADDWIEIKASYMATQNDS